MFGISNFEYSLCFTQILKIMLTKNLFCIVAISGVFAIVFAGCGGSSTGNKDVKDSSSTTASTTSDTSAGSGSLKGPNYLGDLQFKNDYPTNETVTKLYDAIDFQRACQAYVWAIPIVNLNELYLGQHRDFGAEFNQPIILEAYATAKNIGLTANNNTIYALIPLELSKNGPVVIESPAGAYGVIDDWWQRPVTEIGPLGPDKGKGGKYLLLPPDYKGKIPAGYFPVPSTTNKAYYVGRGFVKNGDVQTAINTLKQIKVYPLSQSGHPSPNTFTDGSKPANTIAPRGFEYWQRLADIINSEPVQERDRFFMAMLKPLGIEKGKPFNPDERQKRILTQAADVGFRMAQTISMAPRTAGVTAYPGTHWEYVLMLDPNQESQYYSELDERTDYTFEAITVAKGMIMKAIGVGSQYLSTAKDKNGEWLDGGKNYTLHIPANVPAKEFWSVIVYDNSTRSIIDNGVSKTAVSSNDKNQVNSDGSIDVYFGPTAPAGKEANWIKTMPNKGWFVYFRWYGPTEAFFDKTWKLGDVEEVK
jgi:hypothetical protein